MKETIYYLNEAEAKAHGTIEAVVNALRVHKLTVSQKEAGIIGKLLGKVSVEVAEPGEPTDEVIFDDQPDERELADDESLELEKVYYKVVKP